ncbi:hypothetical protein [Streptomyces albidoflavus]|uniref:hypothetical protein n=1 Tax=Streptomyces albidoflavus TaxID=1886 RepID=UPI0004CACCD6|nr:hypothetical protein [Streptomyces albidoflavus]
MSAEFETMEDLRESLDSAAGWYIGLPQEDADEWVQNILDSHARLLAEQIRNSPALRDYTDDHMSDCNAAADLIDPEGNHHG